MTEQLWYKNAIVYSLDLETFMDGNGDGVGDFEGLMFRLDYLKWLGVDTIWLAPFQPTPNKDNGYDISDYYGVDPRHGSSGLFVEFMHQAHRLGLKVMIDLVVNHSSDEHPWFLASRANPESRYRNWYIWSEKRPDNWKEGTVFPGVQEATWTYDRKARMYYHHRFYHFQPDLNVSNQDVQIEIERIIGYWLELGVSGFRVDAVPFVLEHTVPGDGDPPKRFDILTNLRKFLQWRRGDAILLGEANVLPDESLDYFGKSGDGIQMMFNFFVNQHLFYSLASSDVKPLVEALTATRKIPQTAQWAHFLRNHDELDLGRLTNEQRQVVFGRMGPEKNMQLYDRGIRRRLAPMLGDRRLMELATSVCFALPGTPVIRYGDEIGMGDDLTLRERDSVRTPMQWANEYNAGFSSAAGLIHPVIHEGVYRYERINVLDQRQDPASFLNWTACLIRIRKECPEIGLGAWHILRVDQEEVLGIQYQWKEGSVITLHNFGNRQVEVHFRLYTPIDRRLSNLLQKEECYCDDQGYYRLIMQSYDYKWFRVGSIDRAVNRSPGGG